MPEGAMGKKRINGKIGDSSQQHEEGINQTPGENTSDNGGPSTSGSSPLNETEASHRFFQITFKDVQVEELYQNYSHRSRRDALWLCVILSLAIDITAIISSALYFNERQTPHLAAMGAFIAINIAIIIVLRLGILPGPAHSVLPYGLWLTMVVQLYLDVTLGLEPVAPSLGVGWQVAIIYSVFVILPLKLRWCLGLSFLSATFHTLIVVVIPVTNNYGGIFMFGNAIGANLLLFAAAVVLGTVAFFFIDRNYRRAFLEIKASLTVNLQIEESSREQERLLLSVLPRHVAGEMMKDLGSQLAGQFRKVYMNRHEDVSILFADIVGFTAMSSKVTPSELVHILNDLFATFDKLAYKYHQLRIKILGDCYYCVCGCPDSRPDHAVLAIHMGLSMVEAISYLREKTKSGVNMRVGVHTGAVLGGVLGQNRWQYDVVGKEVTLANQMESGGVAGRVHISSRTASFLDGEFELEPGDGESREDGIRAAGIKTFLVKAVLKPYPLGTLDNDGPRPSVADSSIEEVAGQVRNQRAKSDPQRDLEKALIEREKTGSRLGNKVNPLTMHFRDETMERAYRSTRRRYSRISIFMTLFVAVACFCAQLCVLPKNPISLLSFCAGGIVLLILSVISLATSFPKVYPRHIVRLTEWSERTNWVQVIYVTFAILVLAAIDVADLIACDRYIANVTVIPYSMNPDSSGCDYVTYFSNMATVIQLCALLQVQVNYLLQVALGVVVAGVYAALNLSHRSDLFLRHDLILVNNMPGSSGWDVPVSYTSRSMMLIALAVVQLFYARNFERAARRLFYYRRQMDDMRGQIDVIRNKNEALIYNILPLHVAKDFIGKERRDEDLYSQHYEEAGVMFASCPNFNAHYTEDAVNNNGLEWIRFLNEVLSDYDDLLNEPRFRNVVKIKTVGSTYMAASGINLDTPIPKEATVTERWQHLADLVEFGLALRETLERINAQSFNTFMLRIGIKQGPLLAGVIGAGKPHYDIWGNTVNVASRMDSTGQLGKIQVVEDTMEILRAFGYKFEKRGVVKVKGKGELLTYFLIGQDDVNLPNQVPPF